MNEPFDVQKTIHDRIVMHSKHGVQDAWSDGYIAGLSAALWAVAASTMPARGSLSRLTMTNTWFIG